MSSCNGIDGHKASFFKSQISTICHNEKICITFDPAISEKFYFKGSVLQKYYFTNKQAKICPGMLSTV